jgi:protocatechuate 3,4-dioxygenase beta subunit
VEWHKTGNAIADEVKAKGGYAVAGQVVDHRGKPLTKGQVTISVDSQDTRRFENGWFVTRRQSRPANIGPVGLRVLTFFHEEVTQPVAVNDGQVAMERISLGPPLPKAKLAGFKGFVQDEAGRPVAGAEVKLTIYASNGYFESPLSSTTVTDRKGEYVVLGIAPQEYSVSVSTKQQPRLHASFTVDPANDPNVLGLKNSHDGLSREGNGRIETSLLYPRKITIDSVYQPDGSTDFSNANTLKSQYELVQAGGDGIAMGNQKIGSRVIFDPTVQQSKWGYYEDDLRFRNSDGKCAFGHFYVNGTVGHYDLGEVNFDSVANADPTRIKTASSPCVLNHVYVVRTYEKGCYAKFVIRAIEIIEPK